MQSEKLLANYTCECYQQQHCKCSQKYNENEIFLENVCDVSETLSNIMEICGIHLTKAKAAIEVINYAFLHYDEVRHRIDTVPRKRLCKEDVINDLGKKCLMTRLEAQLSYSIIKRAFKAFYHGTTEGGIRNPVLEAQLFHDQECFWVHAAKRTAQIFASYEGMFYSAQKNYEMRIKCAYKHLYDRITERVGPAVVRPCECVRCTIDLKEERNSKYDYEFDVSDDVESIHRKQSLKTKGETPPNIEQKRQLPTKRSVTSRQSNLSIHLPRCYRCNCPQLICDCDVNRITGEVSAECSQGPYVCRWVRMDDVPKKDPCIMKPEAHQCPIDCDDGTDETDESDGSVDEGECICECDENDECVAEDLLSDYEDELSNEEEELEDYDEESTPRQIDFVELKDREADPRFANCLVAKKLEMDEIEDGNAPTETEEPNKKLKKQGSRLASLKKIEATKQSETRATTERLASLKKIEATNPTETRATSERLASIKKIEPPKSVTATSTEPIGKSQSVITKSKSSLRPNASLTKRPTTPSLPTKQKSLAKEDIANILGGLF